MSVALIEDINYDAAAAAALPLLTLGRQKEVKGMNLDAQLSPRRRNGRRIAEAKAHAHLQ